MKHTVRVENPTPHRRFAMVTTRVPFQPGEFVAEDWTMEQVESTEQHADGSPSAARVRFPVWLEPNEVREEVIPRLPKAAAAKIGLEHAKPGPFQFHQNLNPLALLGTRMDLQTDDRQLNLLASFEDVPELSGHLVQTFRNRTALTGTSVEVVLDVEMYSMAPYMAWNLLWGPSNWGPRGALLFSGCQPVVRAGATRRRMTARSGMQFLLDGNSASGVLMYPGDGRSAQDTDTLKAESVAPVLVEGKDNAVADVY